MEDGVHVPTGIRRGAYVPELESLRGIAILLVFVFHADALLGIPFRGRGEVWPALPMALLWMGHTGVTLFFVLSAFLLSRPFLAEAYGGRHVSRREFYRRRALRILPLFYVAVLVATVATSRHLSDVRRAIPHLCFLYAVPGAAGSVFPYSAAWWSLAVEVQFYVVLPFVALAFHRSLGTTLVLFTAFAAAWTAVMTGWLPVPLPGYAISLSLLGRAPLFLSGILAAWVYERHGDALRNRLARSRWLQRGGSDVILIGVLAALAAFLRLKLCSIRQNWSLELVLLVPDAILWGLVMLGILLLPLKTRALFSNRFLQWLGVLSYSIYLAHFPILYYSLGAARMLAPKSVGIWWNTGAAIWFTVATLSCLALSAGTYRFIEQPFLARKEPRDAPERTAQAT